MMNLGEVFCDVVAKYVRYRRTQGQLTAIRSFLFLPPRSLAEVRRWEQRVDAAEKAWQDARAYALKLGLKDADLSNVELEAYITSDTRVRRLARLRAGLTGR